MTTPPSRSTRASHITEIAVRIGFADATAFTRSLQVDGEDAERDEPARAR